VKGDSREEDLRKLGSPSTRGRKSHETGTNDERHRDPKKNFFIPSGTTVRDKKMSGQHLTFKKNDTGYTG